MDYNINPNGITLYTDNTTQWARPYCIAMTTVPLESSKPSVHHTDDFFFCHMINKHALELFMVQGLT